MRICQIVPSLEEKHGGPSKSVYALARAQAAMGCDVSLLATHPDTPSAETGERFRLHAFLRDAPAALCPSRALHAHLAHGSFDVVHHHSLWLRTLHYARSHARAARVPLVLSPRGMMSDWAWRHHGWRKQLARHLIHPGALEAVTGWHATSEEEAAEIRARGFTQPLCVAPNGVAPADTAAQAAALAYWREACPDVTRRPTALFYSRLHRKKRVLELIDLWLAHAPADWLLLMVGLPEDYTPAELETYVMRASGPGRVRVFDGAGRPAPYAVASLFLLPSHNENFGLVIAEAMASGVPVLVTDTTPWSEIAAAEAGWCVSWSDYANALEIALGEGVSTLAARGERARIHVLRHYSWERSATKLTAFYDTLRAN